MLSVIIATHDSERTLVRTLAALVPGAMAGLVRDVLVADGGSRDDTEAVAEVAGCHFIAAEPPLARQFAAAADQARAPWLLFLRPGIVPEPSWVAEVGRFIEGPAHLQCAAVFRQAAPGQWALREAVAALGTVLGWRPHAEQGLVIAKAFYAALGRHDEAAADPETALWRRIGRRRIVRLAAAAYRAS